MNSAKQPMLQTPSFWIILALIAFLILPSKALDYGIFDSSSDEIFAAMGWSSANLAWLWFAPLLGFWIIPKLNQNTQQQAKSELFLVVFTALFTFISAMTYKISLGYSTIILTAALTGLATISLAKLKIMQGDRFIIASLISIVLLIFFFIVYPTVAIFVSMFYDGDTFAPQQIIHILSQSYIIRVISNSLFLSAFVGLFSTIFGLAFALYTTRIARKTAFIGKIFSILPIVTPPFVVGLGVTLMLGRSGYVTEFLDTYFGFTNHNWLYGFNGIAIAQILAFAPISFMILDGALKSIHPSIEEASYTLRANRYQTFYILFFHCYAPR